MYKEELEDIWACDNHSNNYCGRCELLHDKSCITHIGGISALDKEGDVCSNCFRG